VSALRALRRPADAAPVREPPVGFVRAALVNVTNPNAWIGWSVAAGPALVSAWRTSPAQGLAYLGGFYLALMGGNALVIVAFGEIGRLGPRAARGLTIVSAALLLIFGGLQVLKGIAG
jgi:threonine/homoserine/homoserine lactone efflux protein